MSTLLCICKYFFKVVRGLSSFGIGHPIKIKAKPSNLENTYSELMKLPTNRILISEAGIELASLWNTSSFRTNYTNLIGYVYVNVKPLI